MSLDSTINKIRQLASTYPQDSCEYRVLTRSIKQLRKIMKKEAKKP